MIYPNIYNIPSSLLLIIDYWLITSVLEMTEFLEMLCLKRTTVFFVKETKNVFQLHLNGHAYRSKGMKELLDQNVYSDFFT